MAKKSSNNNKTTKTAAIVASVVVCLSSSHVSAFHSAPSRQLTTIHGPIHPTSPSSSCQTSTRSFSNKSRSRASTTSFLEYANDSAEATETINTGQWWKNVFKPKELDEQDSVDEYLEFLDRRYNRLHSTNEDDEATPLSAIGWLWNGSPNRNDMLAAAHQEEDSLYVLGVAGLASERLLQKHQIVAPPSGERRAKEASSTAIDVNAESDVEDTASAKIIKKVLVPMIRKYVMLQRAKDVFVNKQMVRAQAFTVASLRFAVRSLVQGPIMTTKALLHIGGGKKSIAMTITALTTVLLLLRPVLQAVISETTGPVAP